MGRDLKGRYGNSWTIMRSDKENKKQTRSCNDEEVTNNNEERLEKWRRKRRNSIWKNLDIRRNTIII